MNDGRGVPRKKPSAWFTLTTVILLTALIIAGLAIAGRLNEAIAGHEANLARNDAAITAKLVNERLTSYREALEELADIAGRSSYREITDYARALLNSCGFLRIGYVNPTGRELIISEDDSDGRAVNISGETHYIKAMSGEFYLKGAEYDKIASDRQTVCYAVPIMTDGSVAGVLTATQPVEVIYEVLSFTDVEDNTMTFLHRDGDDFLSADDEAIADFSREIALLAQSQNGYIYYNDANGDSSIAVMEAVGFEKLYIASFARNPAGTVFGGNVTDAIVLAYMAIAIIAALLVIIAVLIAKWKKQNDAMMELFAGAEESRLALENSDRMILRYDIARDALYVRNGAMYTPDIQPVTNDASTAFLRADVFDDICREDVARFIKRIRSGEKSGSVEMCFKNGDAKKRRWYRADFSSTFDDRQKPLFAVIAVTDVTECRRRKAQIDRLQSYIQSANDDDALILEWDLISDSFKNAYGKLVYIPGVPQGEKLDEFVASFANNCVVEEDRREIISALGRERLIGAYYDGTANDKLDFRRLVNDGYIWMNAEIQLVQSPKSDEVKLYARFRDIDAEKRAQLSHAERAETDPLTGALNRRAMESRVRGILDNSRPTDQHAVMMLDIDGAGKDGDARDAAIREIIAGIRAVMFRDDIIGRIGEENFMILLKDIPYDAIISQKAEQICHISASGAMDENKPCISLGIAIYPRDGRSFMELYQNADAALFRVRQSGAGGYSFRGGAVNEAISAPGVSSAFSGYILIGCADDSEREFLASAVEDSFKVLRPNDAESAMMQLNRLGTGIYLIIIDLDSTKMQGFDFMKYIRTSEYVTIPIIAISSDNGIQMQLDAISAGAVDFITRPVDIRIIRVKVLSALKRVENDAARVQASYSHFQSSREERYRRILEATDTLVFINDLADGRYIYPPEASRYLNGNFDSRPLERILVEDCAAGRSKVSQMMSLAKEVADSSARSDTAHYIIRLKIPTGEMHWFKAQFIRMESKGELTRKMLITFNDMNDEIQADKALKFRAERDTLTKLYNIETFYDKARELIEKKNGAYVLCAVDVDNFKVINDQYGRSEGNKVLMYIAKVLRKAVEPTGGICCRVYADNFAYLFPESVVASLFIEKTISGKTSTYDGQTPLNLSIGAYIIDDMDIPVDLAYDRALIAKKSVKGNYINHIAYYNDFMRDEMLAEQSIVAQMESALAAGQFEAYLQPQFEIGTSALVGAEVLVRWNHPEQGLISPGAFIPIFEKNGFISKLDQYIREKTLKIIKGWMDAGKNVVPLSINVSRSEIIQDGFFENLIKSIESYGVPGEMINVEITETTFVDMPQVISDNVNRLKAYGITVEIDDFGSGYSSLNTLKDVPADILKLDMRFMEKAGVSQRGGAIINSIIRMARWLNMPVIAEGVENERQAEFLASIGCRYAQGYLYARPMPVSDFEKLKEGSRCGYMKSELLQPRDSGMNDYWKMDSDKSFAFAISAVAMAIAEFSYSSRKLEIIRVNEMLAEEFFMRHNERAELFGSDLLDMFDERGRASAIDAMQRAVDGEDPSRFDARFVADNGGSVTVEARVLFRCTDSALVRLSVYRAGERG
ncbi:MAG: EAL domain-containing protein [Clostridia bacterium]|nr:EAL domain-containing protein [Clostridia bacterium]